jgi:magnesium transporter
MAYFTKRYHPPGTAPGTLQEGRKQRGAPLKIYLTDYTDSEITELELATAEECKIYLERDTVTWIHVQGDAEAETIRSLGKIFGLHKLALEDVINSGQRPKVDDYKDQLFVVMAHPLKENNPTNVAMEQLSIFIGHSFLISFHPGANDPFEPVRIRLRGHAGHIRERGADYLLYALIDRVIDEGFPLLEVLGDEIEELEEELLDRPTRDSLHRLHHLKRTMLIVRRMLWPQREVLNRLVHDETGIIAADSQIYYRDCYDHTIQIMDLVETYRDMVSGLLDIYLSSVSYRLNEIMRVLTMIATIFIPLTFIVGVYGMNFANPDSPWAMPELRWYYGYPLVWLLMVTLLVGMLLFFKRKKWL